MAFELKPNSGSLFPNDRKTSDTHPDWSGKVNIDGKLHWLNAWNKEMPDGKQFFNVSIGKPVEARSETPARPAQRPGQRPPARRYGDDEPGF